MTAMRFWAHPYYVPPVCGHPACRENWEESGYRGCVAGPTTSALRERALHAIDILDRLRRIGVDVGDGYRLEHPFRRFPPAMRKK